jgi:hypothetical protein
MSTREGVYVAGDYYCLCDICGFKKRRRECSIDWEGKLVCTATCLDERNPQDEIQSRPERQRVLDARNAEPVFVTDNQVQPEDL